MTQVDPSPCAADSANSVGLLCDVNYARVRLGLTRVGVENLIAEGCFRHVWDVGTSERMRVVRILTECVERFRANEAQCFYAEPWRQFLPAPFVVCRRRGRYLSIRRAHLAESLLIDTDHILRLVRQEEILRVSVRVAMGRSPYLDFDSVVEFLKRREVGS